MLALLLALLTPLAQAAPVSVTTEPAGARVRVDGQDVGLSPVLVDLPAGNHAVVASLGCAQATGAVKVDANGGQLALKLPPSGATLIVRPMPIDAVINLDGAPLPGPVGEPLDLLCGRHNLSATLPGFLPVLLNLDLHADERLDLPVVLQPLGAGRLRVRRDPPGATLQVDGKTVVPDANDILGLTAGPHVLSATHPGYLPYEQQLLLEDGGELDLELRLLPDPSGGQAATRTPGPARGSAKRPVGISMMAAGGGALVVGGVQLARAASAYNGEYTRRVDAIVSGNTDQPDSWATDYRDDVVMPRARSAYVAGGLGLVLAGLGAGVTWVF